MDTLTALQPLCEVYRSLVGKFQELRGTDESPPTTDDKELFYRANVQW